MVSVGAEFLSVRTRRTSLCPSPAASTAASNSTTTPGSLRLKASWLRIPAAIATCIGTSGQGPVRLEINHLKENDVKRHGFSMPTRIL